MISKRIIKGVTGALALAVVMTACVDAPSEATQAAPFNNPLATSFEMLAQDQMAANDPSPRTVVERRTLTPNRGRGISAAAAKPTYEIIRTTQVDEYDDPVSKAEALAAPVVAADPPSQVA